ncbi:wall-associated receptor kinase-like 8 [Hibiscus syriacus]|uniref:wall-associated receptor kinase-like 8 n=1 Tax=Hibiscus syriacus TaxID=106335 RepID=UPI001920BC1D|nr:wall-associated receptor kinase-like 8 [Hibiscus syriacus]
MDFHSVFYSVLLPILMFFPILQAAKSQEPASKPVCGQEVCGNVNISLPFGIETGCYTNSWFQVTCNQTGNGHKPYLHRLKLEILSVSSESVVVNNPVTYVDCPNRNGASTSVNLKDSPFFFSGSYDFFGSVGCGNLATVFGNRTDPVAGCLQKMCIDGDSISGCFVTIEDLTSYTVNLTPLYANATGEGDSKKCTSAFLFDPVQYSYEYDFQFPSDIDINTTHVAATLEWINNFDCDLEAPLCQGPGTAPLKSNAKKTCGAVGYPFGIEHGDYIDDQFRVTCSEINNKTVPYIHSINLELLEVSFLEGTVKIILLVAVCNRAVELVKRTLVLLVSVIYIFLLVSILFSANMTRLDSSNSSKGSCGFASVVDKHVIIDWMSNPDRLELTHVNATLRWGTPMSGLCQLKEGFNIRCSPNSQYCWQKLSPTYLCVCGIARYGALSWDVCLDAKCGSSKYRFCHMLCVNTPDNYCSSESCPPEFDYNRMSCTTIGTIFMLLGIWRAFSVLKRRQNFKLKRKYFKRNGGLLLQQHLSNSKGNVEKLKLFTSKEMEKATDYYNENRILGQGGQGTVYKGMLTDGSIVAIKKSKLMEGKKFNVNKVEQFINEVIILCQVNHRNVVKLLGCCLEAQVPLLVYEFIPNGTLYDLIQCQNEDFPLTWEMRLRIAIEIANALFYLHSAASLPIYHRDIKSSNILLDDKYRAKVSDFGISRSVALEQTHLTTRVQGTFGYMDPEYFQSSQFTEKSDVYSFGVVLVELLTGQKPISSQQSEEVRSLVSFFLNSMQENSLFDILDAMVVNNGPEREIIAVAKLAKRCLNLNGKKRPTMKQVAMELELIKSSEQGYDIEESGDEESETDDIIESWDMNTSCSSSRSITTDSATLALNASF